MPLFFTSSCQFGFHINLKPCHCGFISEASPKAQLLFCHFCYLFACLCNALNMFPMKHIKYSHLPMLTQQENLSCLLVTWSKSVEANLLPDRCFLVCAKSELKRNKISPSYFLLLFFKFVRSWSKDFMFPVWIVLLSSGTTLPLARQFIIIISSDSVLRVILNQPLKLHNSCIRKFTTSPDIGDVYHLSHLIFWCALLFLIPSIPIKQVMRY